MSRGSDQVGVGTPGPGEQKGSEALGLEETPARKEGVCLRTGYRTQAVGTSSQGPQAECAVRGPEVGGLSAQTQV